jgi:tetratricopeptide (TPR) repeat protein
VPCYRRALELDPGHRDAAHNLAAALNNLGGACRRAGAPEAAERCYRAALTVAPRRYESWYNLGNVLNECGRFEEAIRCFERSLEIHPGHAKSHYNITLSRRYHDSCHPDRGRIEGLLARDDLPRSDRVRLEFALGKLLDDAGEYDAAFRHYHTANGLAGVRLDRDGQRRFFERLFAVFRPELFDAFAGAGSASECPVFIVGMPRSGTSLVEQIVSAHPEVAGAGELSAAGEIAAALSDTTGTGRPYPSSVGSLDRRTIAALGGRYLRALCSVSPNAARVTDKMPTNFLHVGLMRLLFPRARFIHCVRDAADTCLSCYFQNLPEEHAFAFDLGDLGFFYGLYRRLMAHWRRVLPGGIHEVRYEDLVGHTERSARALVAACGLDWDPVCLEPHRNPRAVKTASSWQVRQPVYGTSVARWKRYEAHVGELLEALDGRAAARPES